MGCSYIDSGFLNSFAIHPVFSEHINHHTRKDSSALVHREIKRMFQMTSIISDPAVYLFQRMSRPLDFDNLLPLPVCWCP